MEQNTTPFRDPATMAKEEAERLHKIAFPESYAEKEEEIVQEDQQALPAEGSPEQAPEAAEEIPVTEPVGQPPAEQQSQEGTADYWKSRFDVLQGKYNAEVPRMADQIRDMQDQMHLLMTAQRSTPSQEGVPVDPVKEAVDRISEVYGDELANDFFELAKAAAMSTAKETLKPVETELANVRTTSTRTAQQSFEDTLTQRVPNWKQTYSDPNFYSFLQNNIEPMTGATYEMLFSNANTNWDMERIAYFFNLYNERNNLNPQTKVTQPSTPKQTPDHLVTPPRRGGGMQTQIENAQGQVYTSKQIADFYQDVRDGKYRGRDDHIRKQKAEFNRAAMEGRVVG